MLDHAIDAEAGQCDSGDGNHEADQEGCPVQEMLVGRIGVARVVAHERRDHEADADAEQQQSRR